MSTLATKEEIGVAKKRISDAIAQARLCFETIINNRLFSVIMNQDKDEGGFPPLRYLESLFSFATKGIQENKYYYGTMYQLIEVLSYFVYYCKIAMDVENKAQSFLYGQSANVRIQVKLTLDMFPKNLDKLCSNIRLLLAYVTSLERSTDVEPTYKNHPLLFQVEKLIFATEVRLEVKQFEQAYDSNRR